MPPVTPLIGQNFRELPSPAAARPRGFMLIKIVPPRKFGPYGTKRIELGAIMMAHYTTRWDNGSFLEKAKGNNILHICVTGSCTFEWARIRIRCANPQSFRGFFDFIPESVNIEPSTRKLHQCWSPLPPPIPIIGRFTPPIIPQFQSYYRLELKPSLPLSLLWTHGKLMSCE